MKGDCEEAVLLHPSKGFGLFFIFVVFFLFSFYSLQKYPFMSDFTAGKGLAPPTAFPLLAGQGELSIAEP
jgi:hypothetical protein